MTRSMFTFVCLLVLTTTVFTQQCLNAKGVTVSWWVMLIYPNTTSTGYAYMDSTFKTAAFQLNVAEPDTVGTPLSNTLLQINRLGMQSVAWNDEMPNGTTSSNSYAHSKSVLTYDAGSTLGFLFDHSIPKYPAFINNQVNVSIPTSEQIYGQHVLCLSLTTPMLYNMYTKTVPIKPFIYANTLTNPAAVTQLLNAGTIQKPDLTSTFTYSSYVINGTQWKFAHKSGKINGSIFQDALNNMLQSRIVAETWGRPIQAPWCGPLTVGNVVNITLSPTLTWTETQDHSKWAYAVDNTYACFGDMNRMTSQWVRGGSFYCLNSPLVNTALKGIVTATSVC